MLTFKKMSRSQLEKHIRSVAVHSNLIFITVHARAQMRKRNVLDAEVYHCLRKGKIALEPEEDMRTGHLICRAECYGSSRNVAVCVALDDTDPNLIVVTVIVKKEDS